MLEGLRDEQETEPDLLAFESIEDMAESSCSSTQTNKASKSAMRPSPVIRGGTLLADESARRCRGFDAKFEAGMGKSKITACECTPCEIFASCPIHYQAAMPKRGWAESSPESKMRHENKRKEIAMNGELVEHVRVSKDPADEAEYSGIHEALAAVAGWGRFVEVVVYPGEYEEPPLWIESNVKLIGLSSSSHLSASQPGCTDMRKPVIVCTDAKKPALISRGTGSLIRNFRFLDRSCNTRATSHPQRDEATSQSSNSRGKRPLVSVTERMETSLSFDWTTPPDCQRLPKAKRRGGGNFEDVVSELAAVKGEMEALRSKIRDEAKGWRSDPSIWGTVGFSITKDAFPPRSEPVLKPVLSEIGRPPAFPPPCPSSPFVKPRVEPVLSKRQIPPAYPPPEVPCMINVVGGKVEVEDCVWDGRPGVWVSQADAEVRRCSGSGEHCPSVRVRGCGNGSWIGSNAIATPNLRTPTVGPRRFSLSDLCTKHGDSPSHESDTRAQCYFHGFECGQSRRLVAGDASLPHQE